MNSVNYLDLWLVTGCELQFCKIWRLSFDISHIKFHHTTSLVIRISTIFPILQSKDFKLISNSGDYLSPRSDVSRYRFQKFMFLQQNKTCHTLSTKIPIDSANRSTGTRNEMHSRPPLHSVTRSGYRHVTPSTRKLQLFCRSLIWLDFLKNPQNLLVNFKCGLEWKKRIIILCRIQIQYDVTVLVNKLAYCDV